MYFFLSFIAGDVTDKALVVGAFFSRQSSQNKGKIEKILGKNVTKTKGYIKK